MAICSLSLGFVSRSEGRSSVGFGAYITGSQGHDQRTGISYNYSNKKEVIHSRILAPEDAPAWALNSHTLWNRVEQFEDDLADLRFVGHPYDEERNKRSLDAKEKFLSSTQTAQTIMGAIPLELTKEQAEACVERFLNNRFVSRKLVTEYAIHWDKGNPHFHAQISRRALIDGELSVRKDREITSKPALMITRKEWEVAVNQELAMAGHEVRIDSRSLEDQGSFFMATHHEGWFAQRLAERGEYSRIVVDNEEIRQRNIEIMCERPEAIIHDLALKRTTFTRKHIEEEIIRRVGGDERLYMILKAKVDEFEIPHELILKTSNEDIVYEGYASDVKGLAVKLTDILLSDSGSAHHVGHNLNREKIYTSSHYKQQEESLLGMADRLNQRASKSISSEKIDQGIRNLEQWTSREKGHDFKFFPEQIAAIHHLCSGGDIRVLNGKAGTGKTTLLKAVAQIYANEGYRVIGTSFQGKAVEIMEQDIGIPCRTLDSLKHSWASYEEKKAIVESGRLWGDPYLHAFNRMKELEKSRFSSKDVILVDEANMIGGALWEPFLKEASSQGAKVLIIQDPAQIKSRDPGDFGRLFAERYGFAETSNVVRQKVEWQRQCSVMINDHRVLDGLRPYNERGHLHWFETGADAHRQMVKDYLAHMKSNPYEARMVLAYTNKEVFELNQLIRSELKVQGLLREHFHVAGSEYSIGDVIRFTENDHHGRFVKSTNFWTEHNKGVKNGSLGTIMAFDQRRQQLTVSLDGERIVKFKADDYKEFTLGYAMGIHKSEGSTTGKTFLSPDPLMDPHTFLVSMTRHMHDIQIYVNHEQFVDFKDLVDQLSHGGMRDTLADYQVSDAQRPYLARVQNYKDLIAEVGMMREEMEWTSYKGKAKDAVLTKNDDEASKKPEPLYKQAAYSAYQLLFEQKEEAAKEILADWGNHLPYVRLAGIRRDVLEVDAGFRTRLLSDLEHRASISAQGYMGMVREARKLWSTIEATHPGALSQTHELYGDYSEIKSKRDFMASIIHENPRLYRQFFGVKQEENTEIHKDYWGGRVLAEDMVYFAGVKDQTKAHYKEHERNIYREGLTDQQKQDFDLVNSYLHMRNRAATVYGQIKKHEENSVQVSSNSLVTQEEFRKCKALRDALALQIVSPGGQVQQHLELLKIDENKLLEHAIGGQTRALIKEYKEIHDVQTRANLADKLMLQRAHDKSKHIMKEADVDFNRLTFDVAFNKGVLSGEITSDVQPDEIYKPIKDYLSKSHEVARLWSMVQAKGKESDLALEPMAIMNESTQKPEWLQLLTARNQNAEALVQNQVALVAFKSMRPEGEAKLYAQAQKSSSKEISRSPTYNAQYEVYKERPNYLSADVVLDAAQGRYTDIVPRILGQPSTKQSNKTQLRFGGDGKLSFTIAGSKAGLWYDFSTSEKGNIFHLIQREKGVDFRGAVEYLAQELNMNSQDLARRPIEKRHEEPTIDQKLEDAQKLKAVEDLYTKAQPIKGSVVETYLRRERSIHGALSDDLKYLPKGTSFLYNGEQKMLGHDCFAAFGRKADGSLSVVQVTKLNRDGTRAKNQEGDKLNKIQYGLSRESFVTLQEGSGPVFIAEGLETAMSIKETGVAGKIVASLGIHNMANYNGPERTIVLCADNDEHKPTSQTHLLVQKSMEALEDKGHTVDVLKPSTPGQDFNDVLKEQGSKGVAEYVKQYIEDVSITQGLPNVAEPKTTLDEDSRIRMNDTLMDRAAASFDDLFKDLKSTTDPFAKEKLLEKLDEKMKLLAKDPTIIQSIKAINEPIGAKLEEAHLNLQEHDRNKQREFGMEM